MGFFKKRKETETIEIDIKRPKLRIAILIGLLVIGLLGIGIGLMTSLRTKTGWQQIDVSVAGNAHAGGDFTFSVYLEGGFMNQSAKKLTTAYSEIAQKAYQIYDAENQYGGLYNLASLNRNPNTEMEVDPALYESLKLLDAYGNRSIFLAPVYEEYRGLFLCRDDYETVDFDPHENPDIREYIEEILPYVNDPSKIRFEFSENNRVTLVISEDYLAFCEEYNITSFLDLFWMRNAFVGDYMADALKEYGVEQGYLTSNDGFIRCMDETGGRFRLALTGIDQGGAAIRTYLDYGGPSAFVIARGYPVNDSDTDLYYLYRDGRVVTPYVDPADGLDHMPQEETVFYGYSASCAEVLMKVYPTFLSGKLTEEEALKLASDGIYAVFEQDGGYILTDTEKNVFLIDEGK